MKTPQTCNEPGCDRTVGTRGYCSQHYQSKKRAGELGIVQRGAPLPCAYPGCIRGGTKTGYCQGHNQQRRRGAELSPLPATPSVFVGWGQVPIVAKLAIEARITLALYEVFVAGEKAGVDPDTLARIVSQRVNHLARHWGGQDEGEDVP